MIAIVRAYDACVMRVDRAVFIEGADVGEGLFLAFTVALTVVSALKRLTCVGAPDKRGFGSGDMFLWGVINCDFLSPNRAHFLGVQFLVWIFRAFLPMLDYQKIAF